MWKLMWTLLFLLMLYLKVIELDSLTLLHIYTIYVTFLATLLGSVLDPYRVHLEVPHLAHSHLFYQDIAIVTHLSTFKIRIIHLKKMYLECHIHYMLIWHGDHILTLLSLINFLNERMHFNHYFCVISMRLSSLFIFSHLTCSLSICVLYDFSYFGWVFFLCWF